MKKFIAASTILALSLIGAPQAAAFSSGSSGSNIVQPLPEPERSYTLQQILERLIAAYEVHFTNRGYTISTSASEMAMYHYFGTPVEQAQIRADLAKIGYRIQTESFSTDKHEQKYQQLMTTPMEEYKDKLAGAFIHVNEYTTKVTLVIAI